MSRNILNNLRQISPLSFVDYKMFLLALYQEARKNDPHFTYHQLAQILGFTPNGIINQMVHGRRRLTVKTASGIAAALGIKGADKRYFLILVEYSHCNDPAKRQLLHSKMLELKSKSLEAEVDRDALEYFSRWYHPVIREILALEESEADPEWLAERLFPRVRRDEVEASLALMVRMGLLVFCDSKNRLIPSQKSVKTPRAVRFAGLNHYHEETIEMGKASLTSVKGKERNISTITVALSEDEFDEIKKKIVDLQMEIIDKAEQTTDGDRVYQLNMQLFPVSKTLTKKGA